MSDVKDNKFLVIALDGATLNILSPLMAEGSLPNLARMAAEGTHGVLNSTIPPITGPAWVSFMTGKNPGKHSVFEFLKKAPDGTEYPISSAEVDGSTLWEILSEAGKEVVVMNVPVTYPPRRVDGVLIADFLTPMGRRDFGFPAGVIDELEERFGPYRLYISEVYSPGKVDRILDELFEVLDYRVKTACYLMETKKWDFFMVHIWGTDRIQHELWHILDTSHPSHKKDEASKYRGRIIEYFRKVDEAVGKFIHLAGEDTSVMVVSDHGFGPIEKFVSFNVWLLDEGFLRLKRTPLSFLKYIFFRLGLTPELGYRLSMMLGFAKLRLSKGVGERVGLFKLVNRMFLSLNDVDWSTSIAYSKGNYGQIFINVKGREPNGSIEPGEHYEKTVEAVIARLRELKDPDNGEKIVGAVYKAQEIYSGPYLSKAPDITLLPKDMRYKALGTVDFTTNRSIEPVYGNYGDHRLEGIFFCSGPAFKKDAKVPFASLIDIAPTILHIMGEKVPDDMDGRVLTEVLDEGVTSGRKVEYIHAPDSDGEHGIMDYDDGEKEELIKRLKELGYMG